MKNRSSKNKTSRRKFLFWSMGTIGVAMGSFVLIRSKGYPEISRWNGKILSARQAYIIMSASSVVLPDHLSSDERWEVARNVDRYIFTLPGEITKQIDLLLEVVENLTFIDFQYKRFTKLQAKEKHQYLRQLKQTGGPLRLVYKTLRDFCMLGYYQQKASWKELNYSGPLIGLEQREINSKYSSLVALAGALPKSLTKPAS